MPIGRGDPNGGFWGVLDGRNHTITNLYVTTWDGSNDKYGLFTQLESGSVVRNLKFTQSDNSYIRIIAMTQFGFQNMGAVAGINYGLIENVSSSADVKGYGNVGGLVGINHGEIRRSSMVPRESGNYNSTQIGAIAQPNNGTHWVGGLVGFNTGTISDSYSVAFVANDSSDATNVSQYCGGFVGGYNGGTITRSYSMGSVSCKGFGTYSTGVGGFFGVAGSAPSVLAHNFARSTVFLGATGGATTFAGFGGTYNPATYQDVIFADNYYDVSAAGIEKCVGFDEEGCHEVNVDGSDPNYFNNNSTNPPFDEWDFANVWQTVDNNLPTHRAVVLTPNPPGGLMATRDNTNYPVSWTALNVTPAIIDYKVEYRVANTGGSWTTFDDGVSTDTDVVIPNLSRSTSYEFRVRAVSSVGEGYPSTPVIVAEDIPSKPTGLAGTVKSRTLNLTWDEIEPGSKYHAEYKEQGTDQWVVAPFPAQNTPSMGVYNLKPSTTYAVRVTARNTAGSSPPSDEITLTTDSIRDYTISTCQQLQDMRNDLAGNYRLANNIDCSDSINWNDDRGFLPVGSSPDVFNGTFDGRGYTISNLYIDAESNFDSNLATGVGLFGVAASNSIHSVTLKDASIAAAFSYTSFTELTEKFSDAQGTIGTGGVVGVLATSGEGVYDITVVDSDISGNVVTGGVIGVQVPLIALIQDDTYMTSFNAEITNVRTVRGNVFGYVISGGVVGANIVLGGFEGLPTFGKPVGLAMDGLSSSAAVKGLLSGGVNGASISIDTLIVTYANTAVQFGEELSGDDFERGVGIIGDTMPHITLSNSESTGPVDACGISPLGYHGGLIGAGAGVKVSNSTSSGPVKVCGSTTVDDGSFGGAMGGMAGILFNSQIFDSSSTSTVTAELTEKEAPNQEQNYYGFSGGLAGVMANTGLYTDRTMVARSHASGAISLNGGENIISITGGLAGVVVGTGTIDNSYSTSAINRKLAYKQRDTISLPPNVSASGGLIGLGVGLDIPLALATSQTATQGITVSNSYAIGDISTTSQEAAWDSYINGGLIAAMIGRADLSNVYASGDITNNYEDRFTLKFDPVPEPTDQDPDNIRWQLRDDAYNRATTIAGGLVGVAGGLDPSYYFSLSKVKTPGLTIRGSHASGDVKGTVAGGLIGLTEFKTDISKTYAEGRVRGTITGGFISIAGVASNVTPYAGGLGQQVFDRVYPIDEMALDTYQAVSPVSMVNTYTTSPIDAVPITVDLLNPSFGGNNEITVPPFSFPAISGGFVGVMAAPGGRIENSYASGTITAAAPLQASISPEAIKMIKQTKNAPGWLAATARAADPDVFTVPSIPNILGGMFGVQAANPLLKFDNILQTAGDNFSLDGNVNERSAGFYNLVNYSEPVSVKNTFSAAQIQANGYSLVGATSGLFATPFSFIWQGYLPASNMYKLQNNYFDQKRVATQDCSGLQDPMQLIAEEVGPIVGEIPEGISTIFPAISCSAVNKDGTQARYFINNKVNAPLDTWDFSSVWVTRKNDFPKFTPDPVTPTTSGPGGTIPNGGTPPPSANQPRTVPPAGSGGVSTLTGQGGGLNNTNLRDTTLLDRFLLQVRNMPDSIAAAIPFFLIVLLIMLGIMYGRQAWMERRNQRALNAVVARYKASREAGQNFVGLTSHYLNTPISIMQTAMDLLTSEKKVTKAQADAILGTVNALAIHVKSMIMGSQKLNAKVSASVSQQSQSKQKDWWPKVSFLVPVVVVGLLLVLLAVIYGAAGRPTNIAIVGLQVFAFLLAVGLIVLAHISREQSIALRISLENQMVIEKDLFEKRVKFIEAVADELDMDIAQVQLKAKPLWAISEAKPFLQGYSDLAAIITRFKNLKTFSRIEPTAKAPVQFSQAVSEAIKAVSPAGAKRKVTIKSEVPLNIVSHTNATAVHQLLTSVLDNAVKFSDTGTSVSVRVVAHDKTIEVVVTNTGPGIAADKLSQLMMPFYRATDVFRFDYEGLGLSLYLDKVIMEHIGGKLDITSKPGAETVVTMVFPR